MKPTLIRHWILATPKVQLVRHWIGLAVQVQFVFSLALLGTAWAHDIESSNGWIRVTPTHNTAAYLTLANTSATKSMTVVKFEIPLAKSTMLHQTMTKNHVSSMRMLHSVVIKPRHQLVLKPKSYHLMVSGLNRPIKVGEKIRLLVHFEDGHSQNVWLLAKP